MIPLRFLSKMGTYKIQLEGVTVDVRIVNRAEVVAIGLAELKPLIGLTTVVGLMVKFKASIINNPQMLQLCVRTCCLLIQLGSLDSISQCLKDFLRDPKICFVGDGMSRGLSGLKTYCRIECKSGIELCELVAMILKMPRYLSGGPGLGTLSDAAGLGAVNFPKTVKFDCRAKVFNDEELMCAIHSVYCSHNIGSKMLAMLL
ncbi:hypothetical protein RHSIM_Rhsim05G0128000 [Rhododendron simsii]|uniref:3'-5' exonuclease domain-containing protein n=1 Tax=Rhododendron simsii TaxID=118357 RepID=A0A834GYS7_RHOSS|nr:hypothetical protein RHSIM_Rhsim05G0128000 [Rhododendron simsii]